MEDDIDDLLNAAERQFASVRNERKYYCDTTRFRDQSNDGNKVNQTASRESSKNQELSDILADLQVDDDDIVVDRPRHNDTTRIPYLGDSKIWHSKMDDTKTIGVPQHKLLQPQLSATTKCFVVYIGGSDCDEGISTSVNKRICDRLRCTDCDFTVSSFVDFRWDESTDYLFLRNNMPDYQRVKSKLRRLKGCRAYACQCKWRNVQERTCLPLPDIKWVCGRH